MHSAWNTVTPLNRRANEAEWRGCRLKTSRTVSRKLRETHPSRQPFDNVESFRRELRKRVENS
jgi:hypothetical protein